MTDESKRDRYNSTYNLWKSMLWNSANTPTSTNQVCLLWQDYDNFYSDMGRRPSAEHTLARADRKLPASKSNCSWKKAPAPIPKRSMEGVAKVEVLFSMRGVTTIENGDSKDVEYKIWLGMIQRCFNPKAVSYELYKYRQPPKEWLIYRNFKSDMGQRPSPNHTLERNDNDKPYSKDNCRWATTAEQAVNRASNRLIALNGETLCVTEWARKLGLQPATVTYRLNAGWSTEDALETNDTKLAEIKILKAEKARKALIAKVGVQITHNGKTQSLVEWCEELDLYYKTVKSRSRRCTENLLKSTAKGFRG